MSYRNEYLIR